MDIEIPFLKEIFWGIGILFFAVFALKLSIRWPSLVTALRSNGYRLSLKGYRKVMIYEGIVLLYFGAFSFAMLKYIDLAFLAGVAALLLFAEGIALLSIQGIKYPFKVLVNSNAITKITNELEVISWQSIKKIDSRQNDIHLIDKEGRLVMIDLEWIEKNVREDFIKQITEIAHSKGIYCSIDCVGEYEDFAKQSAKPIYNE